MLDAVVHLWCHLLRNHLQKSSVDATLSRINSKIYFIHIYVTIMTILNLNRLVKA
jgi:hypothetical protein